ncbi:MULTISPECIES: hypothetical protein [Legionella]|uniref:Dot/Icm T4SS effector n=1 Tax=Legionella resiliens TaxID=2905958 RepID=A0ABS8X1J3_9GAMM|nr:MULTISPECIES: hypothetical protein [unclassified Legionella]MCE0722558.1 hypothetical protein [Legionella sp. 9fVS26]MCE3531711.1 hypothetical protein [Legionella sp. 8cVS16]QLZ67737.1 hypothetical protein FOLKNPGA_00510 [Legionella sp. PC1000]
MQNNLEINISYSAWKEKYVKYLEKNNSGRHGFQNNFYANLLIENFEKTFPGHLSIKVNEQFTALVNKYSYELRAAYGFEWDKSKVEAANHPKFLEFMDELKQNGFLFKPEIKKFAPLLAQTSRTSRDSFFGKLPEDCLNMLASFLEPHLSLIDASTKMKEELQKAHAFYNKIQLFSFEENNVAFSQSTGTHIALTTYEPFKIWFAELPLRQNIPLNTKYGMYKVNDTTLAINSGPNTPGIQIQKRGDTFIVCNNLSADNAYNNMMPDESKQARKNNLIIVLAELKQSLQSEHKKTQEAVLEPQNEEKCSIQ